MEGEEVKDHEEEQVERREGGDEERASEEGREKESDERQEHLYYQQQREEIRYKYDDEQDMNLSKQKIIKRKKEYKVYFIVIFYCKIYEQKGIKWKMSYQTLKYEG